MTLTRAERWMLVNQYRILALLDRDNAAEYDLAVDILANGYEAYYVHLRPEICSDREALSERECAHVMQVLDMHQMMQCAYDQLDDKSGLTEDDVSFGGFDGNNEGRHMSFARFMCDTQGAYPSLRKDADGFNSHFPTRELYERMLEAWRQSKDKVNLTREDLLRIKAATVHPDYR
jgi:hypothetical protein